MTQPTTTILESEDKEQQPKHKKTTTEDLEQATAKHDVSHDDSRKEVTQSILQ